jgi:hypothetical protein
VDCATITHVKVPFFSISFGNAIFGKTGVKKLKGHCGLASLQTASKLYSQYIPFKPMEITTDALPVVAEMQLSEIINFVEHFIP